MLLNTLAFTQTKSKEFNKYLTILEATVMVQVTGVNTKAIPPKIYEVSIRAKRGSHLQNIYAYVGGKKMRGKFVHRNLVSDMGTLEKDEIALLRFENNSYIRSEEEERESSKTTANTKTITLKLSINNHTQTFTTEFHPKQLPKGAKLPE